MTKTLGVLTPPTRSVVCAKCSQIKKQAEEAFTELRRQTDSHIDAIQQQLSEEYGSTINELKTQYDELFSELVKAREAVKQKDMQHEAEMARLKEDIADQGTIKQTISSLEKVLADTQIQLEKSKSQVTKVRSECDKIVDQIRTERDDAVLEVNRLVNKAGGVDTLRHEYEMERARADLAYRKRIGEMESEVRRTEIESVRLRKQILTLNQKIEMFDHQRFSQQPRLFDDLRRSRILSIESEHQPVSGRITRLALPTDQHGDLGRFVELSPAIRETSGMN